jgi:ATP/maltotriose-dependent transcriptional regulator MalT
MLARGIIASIRGEYDEAARLGEEGRQRSETHNHRWNRQLAYYVLARAALLQGDYKTAQAQAQQAYTITQEADDRWFMAYCLNELGNVAGALRDYVAAKGHYEESYAIRKEFDDPEGMALALNHLGSIAQHQADHTEAQNLYQQSLVIYQRINDRGGLATSLSGLGNAAVALHDYQTARHYYQEALDIAMEIQYVPLTLSILAGVGELLLQTGQTEPGLKVLVLTLHHPATEHETREHVRQVISTKAADLAPDLLAGPAEGEDLVDLPTVTTDLLAKLSALPGPTEVNQTQVQPIQAATTPAKSDQPLIEPLSERELEVLRYIAAGLQNREIATELTVTLSTVKTHINNIYRKLEVNNRVQALSRARDLDLL